MNSVSCNQKEVDVIQKCISYRQKQADVGQKKLVLKKVKNKG